MKKLTKKEKIELISEDQRIETQAIEELAEKIYATHSAEIREIVKLKGTLEKTGLDEFKQSLTEELNSALDEGESIDDKYLSKAIDKLLKKETRKMIIDEEVRPDGRKTDEIRDIWSEVDVFPRTHGSAMFKRGATQAMTITTLSDPSRGQLIESIAGERTDYYIHHYAMPPYASGEAGRFGFAKRREIGHGALAQRALMPMIPSQEEFPYTIHVVSEIMSSNGSTSQASVCGSTLSLMAAGVPIKRPVSGIAMGLMSDGKKYVVLSDIQGLEDHVGDMDFKVSGSKEGITAIQMDIKLKGIPREILEQALEQARSGRIHIMDEMLKAIDTPRTGISQYAPKILQISIPADRIGELIGPGGKMIKSIIEESGADINVDEDEEKGVGLVNISSPDQDKIDAAAEIINGMMRTVELDEEFNGSVTRVESYGAFVEFLPGKEGLVHVSKMSTEFVKDATDLVKFGDRVNVRISELKDDGKIGLSMLTKEQEEEAASKRGGDRPRGDRPSFRGGRNDRNDRGGNRGGDRRGGSDRSRSDRSGGFRKRDDKGSDKRE